LWSQVQPEGVVEPRLRVVERGGGGPGRAEAPPAFAAAAVAAAKDRRLLILKKNQMKRSHIFKRTIVSLAKTIKSLQSQSPAHHKRCTFKVHVDTILSAPWLALPHNNSWHHLLPEVRLSLLHSCHNHVTNTGKRKPVKAPFDSLHWLQCCQHSSVTATG